jgi:hypothetical protein
VWATCDGKVVADHERVWATHQTVSDLQHLVATKALQRGRADLAALPPETNLDQVQVRDLARYDALLGTDDGTDDSAHEPVEENNSEDRAA